MSWTNSKHVSVTNRRSHGRCWSERLTHETLWSLFLSWKTIKRWQETGESRVNPDTRLGLFNQYTDNGHIVTGLVLYSLSAQMSTQSTLHCESHWPITQRCTHHSSILNFFMKRVGGLDISPSVTSGCWLDESGTNLLTFWLVDTPQPPQSNTNLSQSNC